MVIDDDEDNFNFLKMVLEDNGYEVVTAKNGEEGLIKAKQTKPKSNSTWSNDAQKEWNRISKWNKNGFKYERYSHSSPVRSQQTDGNWYEGLFKKNNP